MLKLNDVLKEIYNDLQNNLESINIIDDQHFIDNISGVEFHLYDDYFQMTRGEEKPVSASNFTKEEQSTVMLIKDLITDPIKAADKRENYQKYTAENRARFSSWFEQPKPITSGIIAEENTDVYVRR